MVECCGTRPACGVLRTGPAGVAFDCFHAGPKPPSVRKLVYKVAPKYPRELKQNAIGGVVRLSISISPNGSVGKISPIGGNPILVDAATLAVRQWKYVPAEHPTTTEVQLDFIPSRE